MRDPHAPEALALRRMAVPLVALLVWLATTLAAAAVSHSVRNLPLVGTIDPDGRSVRLSWLEAEPPRVGSVVISRRELGQTGHDSWQPVAPALTAQLGYTDHGIRPGKAYEYQVQRFDLQSGLLVDSGYWATGIGVPAVEARGTALMVVENRIAGPLAGRLDRLAQDLQGDGWRVLRHQTLPGIPEDPVATLAEARRLKAWIAAQYDADPETPHALILIGQVPVVRSGDVAPDGHEPRPHPTDLFYGEMELDWPDDGTGQLLPSAVPSGDIEMTIGRIDFSTQTRDWETELGLLAAYLDKDHHWRQGLLGDLRQAYGQNANLAVEIGGLRNIVGDTNLAKGGHSGLGEAHPWLYGVDFGAWNGATYAGDLANKAVFTINFGSFKQVFDQPNNAMAALLAQPWYPLTVGWGGRPSWRLHLMALGAPVGETLRRTVNNGELALRPELTMEYLPTGTYLFRNPIWANLLGDPTLHAFPLAPVRGLSATRENDGVRLAWSLPASTDRTGVRVYRAPGPDAAFMAIDGGAPAFGTSFVDPAPVAGAVYMVRSHGLKTVNAGSFYTLSQGAFARPGHDPVTAPAITLVTRPGQPVRIEAARIAAEAGAKVFAIVAAPPQGRLERDGEDWIYTPPPEFGGTVRIGYTLWDGLADDAGTITVEVDGM